MIKNNNKSKCAQLDICDDYRFIVDVLTNPYGYNFGNISKKANSGFVTKLHNKVNPEYISKR